MSAEIFSFFQTQVNAQLQPFLSLSSLSGNAIQENTAGIMPGVFDALMAEYALTENSLPLVPELTSQNNAPESSQPLPFRNNTALSQPLIEILAGENAQADDALPEDKQGEQGEQKVTENFSSWQNLFADVKRTPETPFKRHENFVPQNDFDDGVTADAGNFAREEMPQVEPEIDTENHEPLHENVTPKPEIEPHNDNVTAEHDTQSANPDIPETTPIMPENDVTVEHEQNEEHETESAVPEKHRITPRKSSVITPITTREIPEDITHDTAPEFPRNDTRSVTPETESPAEIPSPESQTAVQDSHVQTETETPKITEPLQTVKPEKKEATTEIETPKITEPDTVMAVFAAVPPEMTRTENSESPETAETPKNLRAQNHSPRKSQAFTRETESAVSDSESPAETPRTATPDSPRTTQNRSGHEDPESPETTQPSESSVSETPSASTSSTRVPVSPARTSRTEPRTESRNDTRRTEALSDFQTFFDNAARTRRTSSARVSTQPLSLRTETYGANAAQSQSQTLRNGIVNTVRFIRADGVRKANIIVDPPALGRISVELTSSSSGVEASVKVANEQIRQIVQDQFAQLRDNLLQQGVQVSEFTVDVQQDNSRQGQDSGGRNQENGYAFTPSDDDDDTETFRADLEEGLLYWIA